MRRQPTRAIGAFDHIIVGGGTAGCVLANRLSADPARSVLLLEAGGRDWNPMFHIPSATGKLLRNGLYGWKYTTAKEPGLNGRSLHWPRGKVLGGSSSINGMVYIRGHPSDYDRWAQMGNRGWSHEDVVPFFKRGERHRDPGRDDALHGRDGELSIGMGTLDNPLFDAFIRAGVEAGFRETDDFNGRDQEGFARFDFNIENGRRQSAAVAFLTPVLNRKNLTLETDAQTTRIVVEDGCAIGVEFIRGGQKYRADARREIVLAAGSIGTPHLMMLSGLGPADHLRDNEINVVADLPGVGQNLQDHGLVALLYGCSQPITMHQIIRADRAVWNMARAALFRSGPFAQFPMHCGAFTKSRPDLAAPDIQWHFGNLTGVNRLRWPFVKGGPLDRDGYFLSVCLLRPESRGEIRLASPDPFVNPLIRANYLTAPRDMDVMVAAFHQARLVASQPAFDPFRDGELTPGDKVRSDGEIRDWIRSSWGTVHHQVGTCRMGIDAGAVVDPELRVKGVAGLSIADASIMPDLVGGNTHAPVIMIAEKAADMIRARR